MNTRPIPVQIYSVSQSGETLEEYLATGGGEWEACHPNNYSPPHSSLPSTGPSAHDKGKQKVPNNTRITNKPTNNSTPNNRTLPRGGAGGGPMINALDVLYQNGLFRNLAPGDLNSVHPIGMGNGDDQQDSDDRFNMMNGNVGTTGLGYNPISDALQSIIEDEDEDWPGQVDGGYGSDKADQGDSEGEFVDLSIQGTGIMDGIPYTQIGGEGGDGNDNESGMGNGGQDIGGDEDDILIECEVCNSMVRFSSYQDHTNSHFDTQWPTPSRSTGIVPGMRGRTQHPFFDMDDLLQDGDDDANGGLIHRTSPTDEDDGNEADNEGDDEEMGFGDMMARQGHMAGKTIRSDGLNRTFVNQTEMGAMGVGTSGGFAGMSDSHFLNSLAQQSWMRANGMESAGRGGSASASGSGISNDHGNAMMDFGSLGLGAGRTRGSMDTLLFTCDVCGDQMPLRAVSQHKLVHAMASYDAYLEMWAVEAKEEGGDEMVGAGIKGIDHRDNVFKGSQAVQVTIDQCMGIPNQAATFINTNFEQPLPEEDVVPVDWMQAMDTDQTGDLLDCIREMNDGTSDSADASLNRKSNAISRHTAEQWFVEQSVEQFNRVGHVRMTYVGIHGGGFLQDWLMINKLVEEGIKIIDTIVLIDEGLKSIIDEADKESMLVQLSDKEQHPALYQFVHFFQCFETNFSIVLYDNVDSYLADCQQNTFLRADVLVTNDVTGKDFDPRILLRKDALAVNGLMFVVGLDLVCQGLEGQHDPIDDQPVLYENGEESIQVYLPDQRKVTLNVGMQDTMLDLKAQLLDKTGIPRSQVTFILNQQVMANPSRVEQIWHLLEAERVLFTALDVVGSGCVSMFRQTRGLQVNGLEHKVWKMQQYNVANYSPMRRVLDLYLLNGIDVLQRSQRHDRHLFQEVKRMLDRSKLLGGGAEDVSGGMMGMGSDPSDMLMDRLEMSFIQAME